MVSIIGHDHFHRTQSRLQAGVQELEADIAKLKAAITALDGAYTPQRATRRTRGRASRAAAAAGTEVVPAGKLSALLGSTDGLSTAELARRTNGRRDQVLEMLKELEQAGKARRAGQRRSTLWYASAGPVVAETTASERKRATATATAEKQLATALDPIVAS